MRLLVALRPLGLKCVIQVVSFLNLLAFGPILAEDSTTIGDLSARIEELEQQLGQKGGNVNDANPGAKVSQEDIEQLKDEIRALRDAQTGSGDMSTLRDELRSLQEDIRHLKSENRELRNRENTSAALENTSKKSDAPEKKPITKRSWSQTQSPSPLEADDKIDEETDEETESVLKILEQSAPEEDGEDGPPKKKQKKDVEELRESATKQAEETAPKLSTGTPQEKNSLAQYNEALTLYDKGAYKEAERAFSYFIKAYPKDPLISKAMYWKAVSMMKQGNNKVKGAQILFVTAYKKNPKGPKAPDCLLKLGETFALLDNKQNACIAWKKLEDDFSHMTDEMKAELATLKGQYGCKQNSEKAPKTTPKAAASVAKN